MHRHRVIKKKHKPRWWRFQCRLICSVATGDFSQPSWGASRPDYRQLASRTIQLRRIHLHLVVSQTQHTRCNKLTEAQRSIVPSPKLYRLTGTCFIQRTLQIPFRGAKESRNSSCRTRVLQVSPRRRRIPRFLRVHQHPSYPASSRLSQPLPLRLRPDTQHQLSHTPATGRPHPQLAMAHPLRHPVTWAPLRPPP